MRTITTCRVCGHRALLPIIDFGDLALTGYFPLPDEPVPTAPIRVVQCANVACGLVQLQHTLDPTLLFGKTYGYRSGLNPSMVAHLTELAQWCQMRVPLRAGDLVVDVGSSDGTLLGQFASTCHRVGIDPLAEKYRAWYDPTIEIISSFATANTLPSQATLILSVAMFYDLDDPVTFAQIIHQRLTPTGTWVIEQRYLPKLLQQDAYDTFCHEHLAYHSLRSMLHVLSSAGLAIQEVAFNSCNGGSVRLLIRHGTDHCEEARILASQESVSLMDGTFQQRVLAHRDELRQRVQEFRTLGHRLVGYGASTKGNVLLQWCGLTVQDIAQILDVNAEKWGRVTPGTQIPIVPETVDAIRAADALLVLPWHFREMIEHKLRVQYHYTGSVLFPFEETVYAF